MQLQSFRAPTMAEALAQVKKTLGRDAVILQTRTIQQRQMLGLKRKELIEITASAQTGAGDRQQGQQHQPTCRPTAPRASAGAASISSAPVAPLPGHPLSNVRQLMEQPVTGNIIINSLAKEVSSLKSMVQELVDRSKVGAGVEVPEELFSHYLMLIENQVAEEIAAGMLRQIKGTLSPDQLLQSDYVKLRILEQIERLIPPSAPIRRTRHEGPHIVALVGPTGVGKTTTIAKIAANLKLREHQRVGLITLDTFRIAAVDQFKRYAEIMRCPALPVARPEDLPAAVQEMSNCDYVLIDTTGRSPRDSQKLGELGDYLRRVNVSEVHLVLSSAAGAESNELAVQRFSDVRVDKIIFTKLDEAAHLGVVLNVAHKVNKSLSYITTGQDVPNDIEVSQSKRLARLIVNGGLGPVAPVQEHAMPAHAEMGA